MTAKPNVSPVINLNPNSLANQIVKVILVEPSGSLKENINIIKKFYDHIFSAKHIKAGIIILGKTQDEILNKFVEIILKCNMSGKLIEKNNTIQTLIDNTKTTVIVTIENGRVININGYVGHSMRDKLGNLIKDF